jgi:hypothetical protein
MKKADKKFNPFAEVGEPDLFYNPEGVEISVFFIDKYDFKDKVLERQMTYIHANKSDLKILIEEELYTEVPELYTVEALLAQHKYFQHKTTWNIWKFLLGGFGIGVALYFGLNLFLTPQASMLVGFLTGAFFMFWYLFRSMKNDLIQARFELRERMINVFGEKKLDELLDKQEKLAEKRGYRF